MKKPLSILLAVVALSAACKRAEQPEGTTAPATATQTMATDPGQPAAAAVEVGSKMPEYSSTYLDGSRFDMDSKRDKVVLLNLWATWCGPCRYEIPELQAIHDRYAARGFEVIGVSVDEGGADGVRQFVAEQKMTYPVVLDAEGKLANILETSVLPTSIIVDRSGQIVWKKYGAIMPDDQELERAIEKSL